MKKTLEAQLDYDFNTILNSYSSKIQTKYKIDYTPSHFQAVLVCDRSFY